MPKGMELVQEALASISELGREVVWERGAFLLEAGKVEKNLYFVQEGLIRVFLTTEFEEHTIRFGYQGSFINSLGSFIRGEPSEFYVQAIRKSKVWVISKEKFEAFLEEKVERRIWHGELMEEVVCQQIEREVDLLTFSPVERLRRVMERSPILFQEVPAKYIASYLRMTPETLSRIRNS